MALSPIHIKRIQVAVMLIGNAAKFGLTNPVELPPRSLDIADINDKSVAELAQGDSGVQYCGKAGEASIHTDGDPEIGPGFWITNNDGVRGDYFIYENSRDNHPWKYITVDVGARLFVQVCPTWQGHISRGTAAVNLDGREHNLGTWAQASLDGQGAMWGSFSFLQGSDGGGSVKSTDGSGQQRGCTADMLAGAPKIALVAKGSGVEIVDKVVGEGASLAALEWMLGKCSANEVYMEGGGPNPVIKSDNGRLEWVFSMGKF